MFSVFKSSKYLFDCVGTTDNKSTTLSSTEDLKALKALRLDSVDVVKRMDNAELDKLIACCREQLVQVVVTPATHSDIAPFQKFAKYLKDRHRAGVVLLADGRLLVLAPFKQNASRLRCVILKARSTAASAALPSNSTARSLDDAASALHTHPRFDLQADIIRLPSEPEAASETRQRGRIRPSSRRRLQRQNMADILNDGLRRGLKSNNQTEAEPQTTATSKEVVLLSSLPRIERATKIAQLRVIRKEFEAFNVHYSTILQHWSNSVD